MLLWGRAVPSCFRSVFISVFFLCLLDRWVASGGIIDTALNTRPCQHLGVITVPVISPIPPVSSVCFAATQPVTSAVLPSPQAFNQMGAGPISEEYIIYSAEGMPQAVPTEVAARAYNSTALNVTWQPIEHTREGLRGRLLGHRVKYWMADGDETTESLILLKSSLEPWALVVGLQPFTEYYVRVMAYNSAGSGQESERFLERTYKSAPKNPPTAVVVEAENPRTVRVTWRIASPGANEESFKGFKVRDVANSGAGWGEGGGWDGTEWDQSFCYDACLLALVFDGVLRTGLNGVNDNLSIKCVPS